MPSTSAKYNVCSRNQANQHTCRCVCTRIQSRTTSRVHPKAPTLPHSLIQTELSHLSNRTEKCAISPLSMPRVSARPPATASAAWASVVPYFKITRHYMCRHTPPRLVLCARIFANLSPRNSIINSAPQMRTHTRTHKQQHTPNYSAMSVR